MDKEELRVACCAMGHVWALAGDKAAEGHTFSEDDADWLIEQHLPRIERLVDDLRASGMWERILQGEIDLDERN